MIFGGDDLGGRQWPWQAVKKGDNQGSGDAIVPSSLKGYRTFYIFRASGTMYYNV